MQKRVQEQTPSEAQASNQQWWTDNTMSYDWNERIPAERFSPQWFDEIDRKFDYCSSIVCAY